MSDERMKVVDERPRFYTRVPNQLIPQPPDYSAAIICPVEVKGKDGTRTIKDKKPSWSFVLAVYLKIATHADNHTGKAFPSLRTIAKTIGTTRNTVRYAIEVLKHYGWLRVEENVEELEAGKVRHYSHIYYLRWPAATLGHRATHPESQGKQGGLQSNPPLSRTDDQGGSQGDTELYPLNIDAVAELQEGNETHHNNGSGGASAALSSEFLEQLRYWLGVKPHEIPDSDVPRWRGIDQQAAYSRVDIDRALEIAAPKFWAGEVEHLPLFVAGILRNIRPLTDAEREAIMGGVRRGGSDDIEY